MRLRTPINGSNRETVVPRISITILLLFALCSITRAQSHKFDLWKSPSFFRGINVIYRFEDRVKTQPDFNDLRAYGANLAQLACRGLRSVDPPYVPHQDSIAEIDSMVRYCRSAGIY